MLVNRLINNSNLEFKLIVLNFSKLHVPFKDIYTTWKRELILDLIGKYIGIVENKNFVFGKKKRLRVRKK